MLPCQRCSSGVGGVQDSWGAIQPVYNMTVAISNHRNSSVYTRFYADKAVLPIFNNVRAAAAAYPERSGVVTKRTPQEMMAAGPRAPLLSNP